MSYHLYIYPLFYHTKANILSFEIDPPKNLHGRHFVSLTFSNLQPNFFYLFVPLFHMHTKFQVHAISRSAQNRTYIFFSSGAPLITHSP